jgi:DnaJ-class molecular chaperone
MKPGWKQEGCTNCRGHGVVSDYGYSGRDFEGPKDCPACGGAGHLWISPKGRTAMYPGGPFTGRLPVEASK